MRYIRLSILALLTFLLGAGTSPAQSHARTWKRDLYLHAVQSQLVSQDDSLLLDSMGVKGYDFKSAHVYRVLWGNVQRAGDSATILLYTTVTGTMWDSGSLRQRGHRIDLNVEVHHEGLLAAVAAPTLFTFQLGGLGDRRFYVRFGEFILAKDMEHVILHFRAHRKQRGFWI